MSFAPLLYGASLLLVLLFWLLPLFAGVGAIALAKYLPTRRAMLLTGLGLALLGGAATLFWGGGAPEGQDTDAFIKLWVLLSVLLACVLFVLGCCIRTFDELRARLGGGRRSG